jgi:hypothetical protein
MLKGSLGAISLALVFCATGLPSMITLSSPATSAPVAPGTGLVTNFYTFGETTPGNIANADAYVSGHNTPTATFDTTSPVFDGGGINVINDGTTLVNFVGSAGIGFVGNQNASVHNSYFVMTGGISATAGEVINFSLFSDDGSFLAIGDQTIINNDGDHMWGGSTQQVTFAQAGLYTFSLKYFEDNGTAGLSLLEDTTGGTAFRQIATQQLYLDPPSVPEPASFLLTGSAILALVALATRRRKAC